MILLSYEYDFVRSKRIADGIGADLIEVKGIDFVEKERYLYLNNNLKSIAGDVVLLWSMYPNQDRAIVDCMAVLDYLKKLGRVVYVYFDYIPYFRSIGKSAKEGMYGISEMFQIGPLLKYIFDKAEGLLLYGYRPEAIAEIVEFDAEDRVEKSVGADGVVVVKDIGSDFSVSSLFVVDAFVDKIKKFLKSCVDNVVVVAPDFGSRYLCKLYAKKLGCKYSVYSAKGAKVNNVDDMYVELSKVSGKNVIVVDDIISSGGTLGRCVDAVSSLNVKDIIVVELSSVAEGVWIDKVEENKNISLFLTRRNPTIDGIVSKKVALIDVDNSVIDFIANAINHKNYIGL
ncbi:phosphoribosyltransferase family protein [Rickettsiales bacterium]|nr:phosphoribosyltransferase family protein [Rickettsiales bacterium]